MIAAHELHFPTEMMYCRWQREATVATGSLELACEFAGLGAVGSSTPWVKSFRKLLSAERTSVVLESSAVAVGLEGLQELIEGGVGGVGLVGDAGGLGLALADRPGGVGLGRGDQGGALAVGGAADHAGLAFALGAGGRGHPLALAADLLEDGRADLLRIIQPPQPHGRRPPAHILARPARPPARVNVAHHRVEQRSIADIDQARQVVHAQLGRQHRRGHVFQPGRASGIVRTVRRNRSTSAISPAHVPGDFEVLLVPGQHLARRRRVELEPPVERSGALIRPLEMQAGLLDQAEPAGRTR